MESIEVIKEKIIKTDLVLRMYADVKSKYAELFKKYKQSIHDNSILKLDNEMKTFQYSEQSKQIEKLNSDKEQMANQYNSLKLSCDNQLTELVNLQIKYQTLCQDLNDCQKSEEKIQPVEREKKRRKVNKRQKYYNSSADEFVNCRVDKISGISSEEETKSIKIEVLSSEYTVEQQPLNNFQINMKQEEPEQSKKFVADLLEELNRCKEEKSIYIKTSEEREMNLLAEWRKKEESLERKIQTLQEDIEHERDFIKNFKIKKVEKTRQWEEKERILKSRIADLEGKIQLENSTSLKSFEKKVFNMQTKWLEKAQKLNTEIENLKERIQEEKSTLIKNFEAEMKAEWQEREEKLRTKILNLEENIDLFQKSEQCNYNFPRSSVQNEYINDFQSYINNPGDTILRQYDKQFPRITETLNQSQKQYIEVPCVEQNEDTVDSETIMDILNEMRLTLLSPIPDSEDESKHQIHEEPKETDWTARYQMNRRKKEMKYHMLCNMKKTKQKFKLERQLIGQKRNAHRRNESKIAIKPEISAGSNNTLLDSIATEIADSNNVLHKNEQSPVKEENSNLQNEYSNSCSKSPLKKIRKLSRNSAISELCVQPTKHLKSQIPTSSPTFDMNSPHQRRIAPSQLDSSKINIIQDIILKSKNKSLRNCDKKTEGFKRSLSAKIVPPTPQSPPPSSPPPQEEKAGCLGPVIIPLDKPTKMNPDKAGSLFRKLITYSSEEKIVEEVASQFCNQEVEYITRLIAEQIIQDKEKPDAKVARAPLMTDTQRVMFGLMLKLEKMNVCNIIDTYLNTSELYLIKPDDLEQIESLTRLYVAICKSHGYIERIRRFCLDAFYFMGDFAVPFFFTVLTSWIEVLPPATESESFPLIKVVIQIINTKTCNTPGYNLLPLVELLHKFYEYPRQPINSDSFFQELFSNYLKNPVTPADFPLLLYCKNNECKWVYQKIDTLMKPILPQIKNDNFKATLIILIGNIVKQFHGKWNAEYIIPIRDWLKGMTKEENIPEIVKRSLIHAIRKLPKTSGIKSVDEEAVQIVNM